MLLSIDKKNSLINIAKSNILILILALKLLLYRLKVLIKREKNSF